MEIIGNSERISKADDALILEKYDRHDGKLHISKISPAHFDENRVNIYVNGEYSFSLDIAQVVDLEVKIGRIISEKELEDLKKASEFGKLYQRTLEWVMTRPHSVKETRDYLVKKRARRMAQNRMIVNNRKKAAERELENPFGDEEYIPPVARDYRGKPMNFPRQRPLPKKELPLYSDEDIDMVIDTLVRKRYLNDLNFAKFYVENRYVKKGISQRRLVQELSQKGVDKSIIEEALGDSERNDQEEIEKVIRKKARRYTKEKMIMHLVRQGFNYNVAKTAVENSDEYRS